MNDHNCTHLALQFEHSSLQNKMQKNVPLVCEEDTKFEGSLELEIVLLRQSLTFWELHIGDHHVWFRMSVKLVCCLNK